MYHIFEFGVPEGLRSMEAHMKALASVEEGSESVLQGRRLLELAAEEVQFPGAVDMPVVVQRQALPGSGGWKAVCSCFQAGCRSSSHR